MRNRILAAIAIILCFCVLFNETTHFNYVNAATLQKAYIIFRHRAEKIMNKVQKDRWIVLVETGKEEGGGQIVDYLITKHIQEDRKQIQTLTGEKGVTNKTLPEIHELYQDGVALARQHHLAVDIIYEYAYFLRWQREYIAALNLAQWLETYYQTEPVTEESKAQLYNLLGILHKREMHFTDSEQYYRKAINMWQAMLQKQTTIAKTNMQGLANSLCNLGILLCETNRTSEGEKIYKKSFAIRQKLTRKNPDNALFAWDLAASYHVKGNHYRKHKRFDAAKVALQKAIEIEENLIKMNPMVNEYESTLAYSYCALANLYRAMGRCEKAELNYYTANMYFGRLAERNTTAYKLDQAYGYYCMACNYDDMLFERKHAIKLYKRAAKLQEEVIKDHSLAFLNDLRYISSLSVLTGFANRYWNKNEEELPVDIQRYLTSNTSKAYIRDLADSYERLFTLQWNRAGKRTVEQTGRNAMMLYELLSKENPELYKSDLAHVKFLLGLLCVEEKRHVEAEPLLRDSLRLYMQLAAKEDAELYAERLQTLKLLLNGEEEYLEEL